MADSNLPARASAGNPTVISRQDAIDMGLKRYFTGEPCNHGHIAERNVGANNECIECKRIRDTAYAARTKPQKAAYDREYRERMAERLSEQKRKWREETRDSRREYYRRYYAENRDAHAAYRAEHRDRRNAQKREWSQKNRDRVREYSRTFNRERKANDPNYRIACALRTRLAVAVRDGRGGSAVRDLGCSISFLRQHLERQFLPRMTWDNWGLHGWHIDHKRPLSSFDLSDPEQVKRACHYTNLRPMWAFDNLSKGARFSQADA